MSSLNQVLETYKGSTKIGTKQKGDLILFVKYTVDGIELIDKWVRSNINDLWRCIASKRN